MPVFSDNYRECFRSRGARKKGEMTQSKERNYRLKLLRLINTLLCSRFKDTRRGGYPVYPK